MEKMKILWITNIPSPYRVNFFNELGKQVDLTVIFERQSSKERDALWNNFSSKWFNSIFLNGLKYDRDKSMSFNVYKYLKEYTQYDKIVISNPFTFTGIVSIFYTKLLKVNYSIECDGGFVKPEFFLKKFFKRIILGKAPLYLSTSKELDEYYINYGAKSKNIRRYPFTSIYGKDILEFPLTFDEKKILKSKFDIKETFVCLFVGQFIKRKGIDILMKISKELDSDIGLYCIGGVPTENMIAYTKKHNIKNIHFVEFLDSTKVKEYYRLADIFILPTREDIWGLVINEAMANGLPIITTNRCIAGLELANDGGGRLFNPDDINKMASYIEYLIENDDVRYTMGISNIERVSQYTIEKMSEEHMRIFNGEIKNIVRL